MLLMMRPPAFLPSLLVLWGLAAAAPESALGDLVRRLGDPAYKVREAAYAAILALGTEDADKVMAALPREAADGETRAACERLKKDIPLAYARARLSTLGREDPRLAAAIDAVRACPTPATAEDLLAAAGERRETAGEILLSFIECPDAGVRCQMLEKAIDLGIPSLAPKAARFLSHDDAEMRLNALHVLAELKNPAVVGDVVQLFADPDPTVRRMAAGVFRSLATRGQRAEDLVRLFSDQDMTVRVAALEASAWTGTGALAEKVAACLVDPEAPVRATAIRTLAALDARAFSGRIARCLEDWTPEGDEEAQVPQAGIAALGRLKDPAGAPAVARFLETPPEEFFFEMDGLFDDEFPLRVQAARALCRMGGGKALPRLLELLSDPNPAVRRAVAAALPDLADPACIEPLVELCGDPDPETAAAAIAALGRLADALPPRSPPAAR